MQSEEYFNDIVNSLVYIKQSSSHDKTILSALRIYDNRHKFLKALLKRAPYFNLQHSSYCLLVDILKIILAESIQNDKMWIAKVYHVSRMYGIMQGETIIYVATNIRSEPAFLLTDFWIEVTQTLVAQDIIRWAHVTEESNILLSLPRIQVFLLFAINRIHSVVTSMQYLLIPLDIFVEYLSKIMEYYNLNDAGIDITRVPCKDFVTWVLNVMLKLTSRLKTLPSSNFITNKLQDFQQQCFEGGLYDEVGYSPLQELLLYIVELSDANYTRYLAEQSVGDQMSEFGDCDGSHRSVGSRLCVCGRTPGQWAALGAYDCEGRDRMSACLCERCFRQLYSNPLQSDGGHPVVGHCCVPRIAAYTAGSFTSIFYGTNDQPSNTIPLFNFYEAEKTGNLTIEGAASFVSKHSAAVARGGDQAPRNNKMVKFAYTSHGNNILNHLYTMLRVGKELRAVIKIKF